MSSARPSLVVDALCSMEQLLSVIETIDELTQHGDHARAASALQAIFPAAAAMRPTLRNIIRTERQAAEACDLTQRPDVRVICSIGQAVKQPDPANSEHTPTPDTTEPAA
jgi:hypothetical protein